MSKETYDFSDLDAILAEFRGEEPAPETPAPEEAPAPAPAAESPVEVYSAHAEDSPFAPPGGEATMLFELPPIYSREEEDARRAAQKSRFSKATAAPEADTAEEPARRPKRRLFGRKAKAEPEAEASEAQAEEPEQEPEPVKPPKPAKPPRVYTQKRIPWILRALMTLVFLALSAVVLTWSVLYLHPASGGVALTAPDAKLRLSDKLDMYVNNAASDALGDLAYIKKVYTLQESATVAPAPDPNAFGSTYDPQEVMEVINRAAILLDGQKTTFDPTADFVPDEPIRYYLDDTILVITWKEFVERRTCTFAEVKIAHGSQFRRKLVEDTYGSSVQLYASELANEANAVVAANADFYMFRPIGVTVYQRKLYRFNPSQLDICFINSAGDMLFTRAGELQTEEQTQAFVENNDVLFSLAFGPVLVDNGELQYCASYPMGEIGEEYSRSCIAMTDQLHYLLMTVNHNPALLTPRANVNELARLIYSKNVLKAYNLDGGQTSEIVMQGMPINHVDYGNERIVSDIIYFATAIPEEVRR